MPLRRFEWHCPAQGIAPFGSDLAVLAYILKAPKADGEENGDAAADASATGGSERPEVR